MILPAIFAERLRCAAAICWRCEQSGPPKVDLFLTRDPKDMALRRFVIWHPEYGDECEASEIWVDGAAPFCLQIQHDDGCPLCSPEEHESHHEHAPPLPPEATP